MGDIPELIERPSKNWSGILEANEMGFHEAVTEFQTLELCVWLLIWATMIYQSLQVKEIKI